MTHGRNAKAGVNRRNKKRASLLTGHSQKPKKSLESRVASLEARIEQMQEEIDRASGVLPAHFSEAIYGTEKKRPGPSAKISDTELFLNRDNLIEWLEEHWPHIVKRLLAAKNPRGVATVLRPIAATRDIRPTWQGRIVDHPAKLLEFLRSDKFRIRPPKKTVIDALRPLDSEIRRKAANRLPTRQIANAMAGVPNLKWRTSLDKCSKTPSSYRVGHDTAKHYRMTFGITEEQAYFQ
ncbi:MAG TPA: hypothetical protein VGM18_10710 [Candidatus Sulfotelmatobacter sp.]|jgi:hypothetical protein